MILDCSNYESTKKSVLDIFSTTEDKLASALQSINPYESSYKCAEDVLYDAACDILGHPKDNISVVWFHGTRTEDESLFNKLGILTKSEARKFIEPRLKELSEGMKNFGSNPFSISISGKQGDHDEGPFAFLIRDIAIHAPSPNHNYLDSPEIVEDIAGTLLGENYSQLVNSFKGISVPCLVSFTSESKGYEVPKALLYLKLVEDGETHFEAASSANTFFDSENIIVSPDRIKSVEIIENV
ncbi:MULTISPECIES: hypothetical protein [unclassified Pseudoalteromonas]|uniref:hypothetical protein n=1 Tax=unclassified Pseudoalteromonas TaxID=194690 RepID=UPI000C08D962|nr:MULTISPECIES: hypothetical protein [unclassified Pseudoalteromonas]MDP2636011.1 hypothetical protein [Pseudoalteromonas sp. 1_MG-2023]PHN89921.1 hypothetical protein CSC79_10235 [Pseudoalteromonas sp. 3D05]